MCNHFLYHFQFAYWCTKSLLKLQPAEDDHDDDNGADLGDGMAHDDEDMFQHQDENADIEDQEHEIGAFTGDNLIAAPNKVCYKVVK